MGFSKGSYIVTMPKTWVERHNLKKGDTISIEEGANKLVFHAGEKESKKEENSILIDTKDKKLARLKAEIVSAYLNNYSTIEIFSETLEDDAPIIKGVLRNLSGMEIIEQTGKRIVAKDLIDVNSISIQNIIRRMDVITRSMIDDTILCIEGKCNPKSVIHRDADVNRLYYLGFRVIKNAMEDPMLMSKLKTTAWRISSDRRILSRIEEIADRQKRISRLIAEAGLRDNALKEFKQLKDDIKQRYCDVMKAYYNNDKKLAYEIEVTNQKFIDKCDEFLKKTTKEVCKYCKKMTVPNVKLSTENKRKSKDTEEFPGKIIVSTAKITDYTKGTIAFIRNIARTVLNMD